MPINKFKPMSMEEEFEARDEEKRLPIVHGIPASEAQLKEVSTGKSVEILLKGIVVGSGRRSKKGHIDLELHESDVYEAENEFSNMAKEDE